MKHVLKEGGKKIGEIKQALQWKSQKVETSLSYLMRENKIREEGETYNWED